MRGSCAIGNPGISHQSKNGPERWLDRCIHYRQDDRRYNTWLISSGFFGLAIKWMLIKREKKTNSELYYSLKGWWVFLFIFFTYTLLHACLIESPLTLLFQAKNVFSIVLLPSLITGTEKTMSPSTRSVWNTERKRGEFTYNYWMATDVLELSSLWKCVLHLWSRCTFHTYSEVNKTLHTLLCSRGQITTFSQGPQFASCAPIPTLVF